MSNFDANQLDKALMRRLRLSEDGRNPPPELHLRYLATKYGCSLGEVQTRIKELNVNKPRLEGQTE